MIGKKVLYVYKVLKVEKVSGLFKFTVLFYSVIYNSVVLYLKDLLSEAFPPNLRVINYLMPPTLFSIVVHRNY